MTTPADLETPTLFQVQGLVAVVSGASSGIGLMAAQALAANGARVYIIGKKEEILDMVAEKYSASGQIIPLPGDTTTSDGITGVATVLNTQEDKDINILINSASVDPEPRALARASRLPASSLPAGGASREAGIDFSDSAAIRDWMTLDGAEAWRVAWAGSVTTHHFLIAVLLPLLDKGANAAPGHSSIVLNVADLAGLTKTHSQGRFAHSAAMAGLLHLTKEWAYAFWGVGVRVNCIAPALVESEMRAAGRESGRKDRLDERVRDKIPAGRAGEEADVASAVLYLCSRAGTYINGQVIHIDGGLLLKSPATV